jgi:hypothetical protein
LSTHRAPSRWHLGRALLVAVLAASCGGGPGAESLHDGAETMTAAPDTDASSATAPASGAPGAGQALDCWREDEGCRCTDWGATVECKARVSSFGDYVSCAGVRQCVRGYWGPCIPPTFHGASGAVSSH